MKQPPRPTPLVPGSSVPSSSLLRTENLTRTLPAEIPTTLVNQANVTIQAGEFIAIVGPSGSGKSSLLYLLGLLDKPTSGSLVFDGLNMSTATEHQRAHTRLSKMGFVFQFHFLLPEFSALENILLPLQQLGEVPLEQGQARAIELLTRLGLKDQMHKRPHQLSGGQSQRVAIARALINKPRLLLADEPTGNLDSVSGNTVKQMFRELTRTENCALAVVTHDDSFAAQADRIIHIVDGHIVDTPSTK